MDYSIFIFFFFSSRRRHTIWNCDWSSDVCSSDLRPGFSPYGPAKAALEAWSASLAGELEDTGITVNVVVPGGPADTAMVPRECGFDRSKLVAPERMAPPILWLCTGKASCVTGARFIAADWHDADPSRAGA